MTASTSVDVFEVAANPDPLNHDVLRIEINFEIKATHDRRSLVFPFYRIPGESAVAS